MKLSLREKQSFYSDLARLLRSGSALSRALALLMNDTRGGLRRFLRQLSADILRGDSAADAFAKQRSAISEMELSILSASERSGHLDRGCGQLAAYFAAMDRARAVVLKRSIYPLFLLHFGIFTMALPTLLVGGGAFKYFKQTAGVLFAIYAVAAVIVFLAKRLLQLGRTSITADRFLRMLPMIRKVRTSFAAARFCATYDAQLDAGVSVLEAFPSAARASGSALLLNAALDAMPDLRAGTQVSLLLGKAFPKELVRAFQLAEEAGDLDQELKRLAEHYEQQALQRVETLSEWLPKIIYFLVVVYLGYQIVNTYVGVFSGYEKAMDF